MKRRKIALMMAPLVAVAAVALATTSKPQIEEVPTPKPSEVVALQPIEVPEVHLIPDATLTHYCICKECCGKDPSHPAYGITKSGRKAEPYLSIAVDPDVIPLGSKVFVEYEDGTEMEYRADDTGSLVKGNIVDLCVSDHQEARQLGKKAVTVRWTEE